MTNRHPSRRIRATPNCTGEPQRKRHDMPAKSPTAKKASKPSKGKTFDHRYLVAFTVFGSRCSDPTKVSAADIRSALQVRMDVPDIELINEGMAMPDVTDVFEGGEHIDEIDHN